MQEEIEVITFGCRLNSYESELIKKATSSLNQKNLLIFNSCAVTSEAERQLRQSIRKHKKQNPDAKIIVTGCAAQISPEKYATMSEVDIVLGNQEKFEAKNYIKNNNQSLEVKEIALDNSAGSKSINSDINHKDDVFLKSKAGMFDFLTTEELSKIKVNDIMSVKDTAPQLVSYFENRTRAFLEIQNGCNHRCTFCIIPYGRGNSRSIPLGEIVKNVKELVRNGHKEVVLTGVDISDYGKDLAAPITLSQMIRRLLHLVPELPRLRLSSIDVAEIDEEFFDILKNEPRLMPYLHLSVQSGDDLILKRMKRRHNRSQVIEFCKKARQIRPNMTFGADIIAGFPTESEEAFQNSINLIKESDLIFTHIFPYSPRQGTPAAKMPQLNKQIIKERAKKLREAGQEQLQKYLSQQIGKKMSVIIEKDNMGKSENFLDAKIDDPKLVDGAIYEVSVTNLDGSFINCSLNSLTKHNTNSSF